MDAWKKILSNPTEHHENITINEHDFRIKEVQSHDFYMSREHLEEGLEPLPCGFVFLEKLSDGSSYLVRSIHEPENDEWLFSLLKECSEDFSQQTLIYSLEMFLRLREDWFDYHQGRLMEVQEVEVTGNQNIGEELFFTPQCLCHIGDHFFYQGTMVINEDGTFFVESPTVDEAIFLKNSLEYQVNNQRYKVADLVSFVSVETESSVSLAKLKADTDGPKLYAGFEEHNALFSPTSAFLLELPSPEDQPKQLRIVEDYGDFQPDSDFFEHPESSFVSLKTLEETKQVSQFEKKKYYLQVGNQIFEKKYMTITDEHRFYAEDFPLHEQERKEVTYEPHEEQSSLPHLFFLLLVASMAFFPLLSKDVPLLLELPTFEKSFWWLGFASVLWVAWQKLSEQPLMMSTQVLSLAWAGYYATIYFLQEASPLAFHSNYSMPFPVFLKLLLLSLLVLLFYLHRRVFQMFYSTIFVAFSLSMLLYFFGFCAYSLVKFQWQSNFFANFYFSGYHYVNMLFFVFLFLHYFWSYKNAPLTQKQFVKQLDKAASLFPAWKEHIAEYNTELRDTLQAIVSAISIGSVPTIAALEPCSDFFEFLLERVDYIETNQDELNLQKTAQFDIEMKVFSKDWQSMINDIQEVAPVIQIPRIPHFFWLPMETQEEEIYFE